MATEELTEWLSGFRLSSLAETLATGGYTTKASLEGITEERLSEIGVVKAGHRKKILFHLNEPFRIREKASDEPSNSPTTPRKAKTPRKTKSMSKVKLERVKKRKGKIGDSSRSLHKGEVVADMKGERKVKKKKKPKSADRSESTRGSTTGQSDGDTFTDSNTRSLSNSGSFKKRRTKDGDMETDLLCPTSMISPSASPRSKLSSRGTRASVSGSNLLSQVVAQSSAEESPEFRMVVNRQDGTVGEISPQLPRLQEMGLPSFYPPFEQSPSDFDFEDIRDLIVLGYVELAHFRRIQHQGNYRYGTP